MSAGRVAAAGGGSTFALAAVAGVLGNQLTATALWAWAAFAAVVAIGAAATAWTAHRTTARHAPSGAAAGPVPRPKRPPAPDRLGPQTNRQTNTARDQGRVIATQHGNITIHRPAPIPGPAAAPPDHR
ncbi:hypothetical protein GCM10027570_13390 [Streptomonospora sediminis]